MNLIDTAQAGREARVRLDPDGRSFLCGPGQTVLAAALAAGIDLPYECASGSCGSCRARLVEGSVASLWADAPGLSERDRRKGDRILCCQGVPQGDCVIQARPGEMRSVPPPVNTHARVSSLRLLNADVLHLTLQTEQGVAFLPGQFMLFALPAGIGRRAYSMCSLPDAAGRMDFLIKRKRAGLAGRFLFEELKPGDVLALEGPYGRAWLREDSSRDIVLLAGGSGLAPVWSIAQAALTRSPQRRLRLYFGVNHADDVFWLPEIEQASRVHANLDASLVLVQASPQDPSGCRHGMVGEVMSRDVTDLSSCDLYMAGPPGLIDSVMRGLVAAGRVQADRVFFDRFC